MPSAWKRVQGSLILEFTQIGNLEGLYDKNFIQIPFWNTYCCLSFQQKFSHSPVENTTKNKKKQTVK